MLGRAASTLRLEGCRPEVSASSSLNPILSPDTGSGLLKCSLIWTNVSLTSCGIPSKKVRRLLVESSKTALSAWSSSCSSGAACS
jgi:hypothetical protein